MKTPFRGFRAILFKEFTVVFRDRATLFFMFFPPLVQIIAFGFALDNDVKHIPMMVFNEDRTVESRRLIGVFENTQTFRCVGEVSSAEELSAAIRRGKAYVGLEIPPGFTRQLRAGRPAQIQLLIDGSSSSIALSALNTGVSVALRESVLRLLGEAGRRDLPVEVRPQVLYNPEMRSPNFFVPGVIGIALLIATVFSTAMSVVRERERGTLEQLLVSPLSPSGFMLGKLVPYLCISMTMALGLFAIQRWIFQVAVQGPFVALLLATAIYIFTLLSLGLLISARAQSQMQALQATMGILLPSIFFSGFIFPRETMPWIFYAISTLLPATYFIELSRAIILRGATLAEFWAHLTILAAMGLGLFLLCARRFKRKVA